MKDDSYWEEVRRAVGKGTWSLLWDTSTRSLRKSLEKLRKVTFDPQVGDVVCDCRFRHLRIIERDGDDLVLEDWSRCSLKHCCDPPDHPEAHPE